MMKILLTRVLALAVLACIPASAASGAVALSDLISQQGSIISGDKVFDQFQFSRIGGMPSAENILVEDVTDLFNNHGIRISGPFLVTPSEERSIATLNYRVTAVGQSLGISGALLQGNPAVVNGIGFFRVSEILAAVPSSLQIHDEIPGETKLVDSKTFDSTFSQLNVELILDAEALSGATMASFVDQTFSQSVVPEPTSIVVWLGMVMLVVGTPYVYRRYAPARMERRS